MSPRIREGEGGPEVKCPACMEWKPAMSDLREPAPPGTLAEAQRVTGVCSERCERNLDVIQTTPAARAVAEWLLSNPGEHTVAEVRRRTKFGDVSIREAVRLLRNKGRAYVRKYPPPTVIVVEE